MRSKKIKFLFFPLLVVFLLSLAPLTLAANLEISIPMTSLGSGNAYPNPGEYVKQIFIFGFYLMAFLAVGTIVIGGIMYMMAGTVGTVDKAKSFIWGALGGMAMLLGSYLLLYTIGGSQMVNLAPPGLDLIQIPPHEGLNYATNQQLINTWTSVEDKYSDYINAAALKNGLDPALIKAVMMAESGGDPTAVNPKSGATGLMQLMPKYNPGLDLKDPQTNIETAAKMLAGLKKNCNSDLTCTLASYNQGPNGFQKNSGGQLNRAPAETQKYVPKVINYYNTLSANKT